MRFYSVTLHVQEPLLPDLLQVVNDKRITLVGIVPVNDEAVTAPAHHYVGGKRNKGISGEALVFEIMTDPTKVYTPQNFTAVFAQRGFASSSYSPVLSRLAKDGKIRSLGNRKYVLLNYVVKK